jgi:hypothetical protein
MAASVAVPKRAYTSTEMLEIILPLGTEGFSFAQLREIYILGSQSAFEQGRDIRVADIIEAIELHAVGAQDLKTSVAAIPSVLRSANARG